MLKINLLTERRDAEREYRKMRDGVPVVDYLTIHLDTTVRRRVHQKLRNVKKQAARRNRKIKFQLSRRTGMSAVGSTNGFLGKNGAPNCDVHKVSQTLVKDPHQQQFSRCLFCGTEFTDGKGRETLSNFAFCGETSLISGECKRAWIGSQPQVKAVERQFNLVTPEDVDHAERTRPMMPRPAHLGNGKGARPIPPNTKWKWENQFGWKVVEKQ
jgi:hypothetical protein